MRPPPSRPIESPRRYPGNRAIVRNDGRPASAAPRRSGSQAITRVGLHASHKQPPARRPRFKSVDIVGFEFVARHNLVVQQAPIRGLERRSWIIRKGNQLVGMAADLRVVGFGSPSAAGLQFCSAANAGAAPAAPETPACVPFRSFGGPVPRVPPRCELQKSQARRRPRGRVLPARVPKPRNRGRANGPLSPAARATQVWAAQRGEPCSRIKQDSGSLPRQRIARTRFSRKQVLRLVGTAMDRPTT